MENASIYQLQPLSNDSWNLSMQNILFLCFEYFPYRAWIVDNNKMAQHWTRNEKEIEILKENR